MLLKKTRVVKEAHSIKKFKSYKIKYIRYGKK